MKKFKFIVINKNDMSSVRHFSTSDAVGSYFLGRKMVNHLILINEEKIISLNDIPYGYCDIWKLETFLDGLADNKD